MGAATQPRNAGILRPRVLSVSSNYISSNPSMRLYGPTIMILIALGSNMPTKSGCSPAQIFQAALAAMRTNEIVPYLVSRYFSTPAWPDPSEPAFLNAVSAIHTRHSPKNLLTIFHKIENEFGRTRGARNASRTLDLDILDYNGRIAAGPPELPHPRMTERAFVMLPLSEVAPTWRHPVTNVSLSEIITALPEADRARIVPVSHPA